MQQSADGHFRQIKSLRKGKTIWRITLNAVLHSRYLCIIRFEFFSLSFCSTSTVFIFVLLCLWHKHSSRSYPLTHPNQFLASGGGGLNQHRSVLSPRRSAKSSPQVPLRYLIFRNPRHVRLLTAIAILTLV